MNILSETQKPEVSQKTKLAIRTALRQLKGLNWERVSLRVSNLFNKYGQAVVEDEIKYLYSITTNKKTNTKQQDIEA